jgi:predicted anti-sigma-YlaC factor YlaD
MRKWVEVIDSHDLTCKEMVEIVTDYLEGSLNPEDRRRFEIHLQDCSGCRTYLEQMRQTIWALGRLSEQSVSLEAQAILLHAFRNWKKRSAA